ncbi:hypothetical protein [Ostreibacterium oceani]|uniref:Uncharacterized protein n=1 Tax=Ostreibacterium oceani TaxID=2654998 RepID=A0A6N7EZW6_9GAMM|nr:hypothetical protein [Ostreibacterium oceani]MPV86677.1 hypothetical protein [Ostreibacterium oceani]
MNSDKKAFLNKFNQIFERAVDENELIIDLVPTKWFEVAEWSAGYDLFYDDLDYLSMAGEIDLSDCYIDELTVGEYCEILVRCQDMGLSEDICFINESVKKIKRKLSLVQRKLEAIAFFGLLLLIVILLVKTKT